MKLDAEVIVIGSGAGGGVVAATLAAAGRDVLILEEGAHVRSSEFTQRDADMYAKLFRDRGMQASDDASVLVLQGRCVGGSTVVNQADVTPIPPELFAYWAEQFELSSVNHADFERAAAGVRARIGAGPIADHEINANNRLLHDAAAKRGLKAGYFEDNRVGCIGSGYCHLGCAYDAKRSVLVTYIPDALQAGARLLPRHRAVRILIKDGQAQGVEVEELGSNGAVVAQRRLACRDVFVCAGAIHTPLLLLRSKLGGSQVGRHLSLQPQGAVLAEFPEPLRSFRGIPQAAFVDHFEQVSSASGFGGFRLESIFGPPATATGFLPGFGQAMAAILARYDRLAACLVLAPDRPSGRVTAYGNANYPRILYSPDQAVLQQLQQGMRTAAELYLEAGAVRVWFAKQTAEPMASLADIERVVAATPWRPTSLRLISAHPQGTARMSDNKRRGVVDGQFRVRGVKGVYVADASVFPTTASSHTMLPIMSFAQIAADRYIGAR